MAGSGGEGGIHSRIDNKIIEWITTNLGNRSRDRDTARLPGAESENITKRVRKGKIDTQNRLMMIIVYRLLILLIF